VADRYPPGATGTEYELTGPESELLQPAPCPRCGERELVRLEHHDTGSAWVVCLGIGCGYEVESR
jgi:predicted RNA-binding Zn-ribbon protein involved in translation (DUF1610 family)